MYYLSHSAKEIDEKIKRVPLATASESKWVRTDDWTHIADQKYEPGSAFAQSGTAVAEAINNVLTEVDVKLEQFVPAADVAPIPEEEIDELFEATSGDDTGADDDFSGSIDSIPTISDEEIKALFADI